jgi:hypothetical protein
MQTAEISRWSSHTNSTRDIHAVISISDLHVQSLTLASAATSPQPHGCLAPGFCSMPQDRCTCAEDHDEGVLVLQDCASNNIIRQRLLQTSLMPSLWTFDRMTAVDEVIVVRYRFGVSSVGVTSFLRVRCRRIYEVVKHD